MIENSSVKQSVFDYEYIKVVIGMLSDDLKIELKTILITYRDSLYVSPLDRLVRYSLYIRDISRYETIQKLLEVI